MRSKISIELDFEKGNMPVIEIKARHSDDVRDKLIQSFIQSLQHTSRWTTIQYRGEYKSDITIGAGEGATHLWQIVPITPKQLEEEIKLMQAVLDEYQRPVAPRVS